jgi:hypothetical protein
MLTSKYFKKHINLVKLKLCLRKSSLDNLIYLMMFKVILFLFIIYIEMILYFNLPYQTIIKDLIVPIKLYPP